jgi:hypothetical protein
VTAGDLAATEDATAHGADEVVDDVSHGDGGSDEHTAVATHGDLHAELVAATWHPEVLDGPLPTRALLRIDEALRLADETTGLTFSVYIGDLQAPSRGHAEKMHGQLADPDHSVFIAISPNQRQLEIVTGSVVRRRLPDRDCKLAALSMAAAFGGGDLGGGIVAGLAQLADHAGRANRR